MLQGGTVWYRVVYCVTVCCLHPLYTLVIWSLVAFISFWTVAIIENLAKFLQSQFYSQFM